MIDAKQAFYQFLLELELPEPDVLLSRFELYHSLLLEQNSRLNLFSRATPKSELWTKHFLDSLVPLKCIDFTGKKVIDFGSGGGLPGIPIKLAVPSCRMTLLDSVRKKTVALQEMVGQLELKECEVIWSRLEDHRPEGGSYDLVLLRAVRLEERYRKPLRQLLTESGCAIFYKAQDLSDIAHLGPEELWQQDFDFGQRAVYSLDRARL
ncbi:MAG: 16S rRNA (guanine(527)-N(7))-methyltransferase RsmG [Candidatus Syntrophosphaera sp.]|nr:16S rRNA (guanine(527)-N(7))-methyltransferase RsmG [Candidatus Syntrophosphaera sp.]